MARATFVQRAQKDYPEHGIKKGESYYWWKFRYGGKRFSKTPPKRSQLTQSSFYSTIYDIEDDLIGNAEANESLASVRDDVVSQLEDLKSECESSLDNMPDGLKEGDTGQLLQERIDALESAINDFEALELDDFDAEEGSKVLGDQTDSEGPCRECGEDDRHALTCSLTVDKEAVDDEERTESEYWEAKLEEFSAISIEAP